jgi:hypothetical protein
MPARLVHAFYAAPRDLEGSRPGEHNGRTAHRRGRHGRRPVKPRPAKRHVLYAVNADADQLRLPWQVGRSVMNRIPLELRRQRARQLRIGPHVLPARTELTDWRFAHYHGFIPFHPVAADKLHFAAAALATQVEPFPL